MRKSSFYAIAIISSLAFYACEDASTYEPSEDAGCDEGSSSCKNGMQKTCENQVWKIKTCADGCNKTNTACKKVKECENGSQICLNDSLKICVDEEWERKDCKDGCKEDGTDCKGGTVQKECQDGSYICLNDTLKTCVNGKWQKQECTNGCREDGTACEGEEPPEPKCTEGESTCSNGVKSTCVNGSYQKTTCPDGCNAEKTDCADTEEPPLPECNGTQTVCENGTQKVCNNGAWQTTTCPNGCNSQGTDCEVPKNCSENETVCADGKLKKCVSNTWTNAEDCANGCTKDGKACAKCKEGTTCKNGKQTTCKDDNVTEKSCQYGCDAAGKQCDEIDQSQPTRYLMKNVHSPITPSVVEQMKKIKAKNGSRHDDVFIEIGDSHYDYDNFMTCFSDKKTAMTVTWGDHSNLKEVVSAFQKTKDSFARDSLSALGGRSTRDMYSKSVCSSGNCINDEINAMNPRFAFFGHGSNDLGNGSFTFYLSDTYPGYQWSLQDYYRQLNKALDQLTNAGIIPLISGVAPCFMKISYINFMTSTNPPALNPKEHMRYAIPSFNAVSRGVAEARQLPWLDIYSIFYPLPDHGLTTDYTHCRFKSSYNTTCDFSSAGEQYGCNARNLYTVEMLDRAWRALTKSDATLDPIDEPFRGKGTQADPYLVTSIPFTHEGNTKSAGESKINVYSSCSNNEEYGSEIYYKLVLTEKHYLRMFAVSATGVDVDLHVMKDSMSGDKCIARSDVMAHGYLEPGTYYISVDTYGTAANASGNAGQYLLGIVDCSNKENGTYSFDDYDVDKLCREKPLHNVKG